MEIETRALLHRRKLDRRHRQLFHLLLNKHKAPEFVFKPVEVLLRAVFSPAIRPACALERIEAKVNQGGHVSFGFFTQPAPWLGDETILQVALRHRTDFAVAEIPDFVPCRRYLTVTHG